MRAMVVKESVRRSAAMLLTLVTILALVLFLLVRPLRLESPASGGARAKLRLDHALGATVEPVDATLAGRSGLPSGEGYLVVTSIAAGGPAAEVGLRVGDVIEEIGGEPASQAASTESSVPMSVWRDGKTTAINVPFESHPRGRS